MINTYEAGTIIAALARQHGVKRQTISQLLKREGVAARVPRTTTKSEIDQAVQLYASGLSPQKIGDQLGWDHNTISRHLKRRGVVMPGPSDWKY